MTRINCVPVTTLTNKHLMAEYKEITRPFTKMRKRIESGNLNFDIPSKYTLGAGHETFFFNKLRYVALRRKQLYVELLAREVKVSDQLFSDVQQDITDFFMHTPFWNNWQPTPDDMYKNMARLVHREFGGSLDDYK